MNQSSAKTGLRKLELKPVLVVLVYMLNLAFITALWWKGSHLEAGSLHGLLTIFGRLTGLISAYAALWQLLLIGRMPLIKQAFGIEKELNLHRWNGYVTIYGLLAHIVLSTTGYALTLHVNVIDQLVDFVLNYEDVLKATLASVLMIGLTLMSVVIIRRHLKYETWYLVHLSSYLAIVLGFGHQLSIGTDFIKQPAFTQYWWALYLIVFGLIIAIRLILPIWLSLWQGFKVVRVQVEANNIYSIYITGRNIKAFRYEAGQFAFWRFLSGPMAWQGHPFSFSSHPGQAELRVTFKAVGDYTDVLKNVRVGTRVIMEGPFGNFTLSRAKTTSQILMIAGGIGLTPLVSMLGDERAKHKDIHLIYAAHSETDLALVSELKAITTAGDIKLTFIVEDSLYHGLTGRLDREKLRQIVPDLAHREVLLCGPPAMMDSVQKSLIKEGIPKQKIHSEKFAF